MTIHNVAEAKAHFSELLAAAVAGEEVIVARAGKPIVRIVPIAPPARRELGFESGHIPDEFFDPLSDDELAAWE